MEQTEKQAIIQFAFQNIEVINFFLDNSPRHNSIPLVHQYAIEINAASLVDPSQNIICIDFIVRIFTNEQKDDKVCEMTLRISFSVLNFNEVITFNNDQPTIPDQILDHLVALTISTARGILFDKLQGSFLSRVILPPVNVPGLQKIPLTKPLIQ